jgi:hypothetical protein
LVIRRINNIRVIIQNRELNGMEHINSHGSKWDGKKKWYWILIGKKICVHTHTHPLFINVIKNISEILY